MITTARGLRVRQLLTKYSANKYGEKKEIKSIWLGEGQEEIITHKSWVSLLLILRLYSKETGRLPVLYVPDYYCSDTLREISGEAEIVFYQVTSELLPDYKVCKMLVKEKKPDLFIFTHYFGKFLDASTAVNFCKLYGTLLIEDAAHVFLPYKKIGIYGDFTLFSPWKSYGLLDGAVLVINKKGVMGYTSAEICHRLKTLENELPEHPYLLEKEWIAKKLIQKIVPNIKHLNNTERESLKSVPYRVSTMSRSIIEHVERKELEEIGERKKENYLLLAEYLKRKYDVEPLWELWESIPYALIIKTKSVKQKHFLMDDLNQIGLIANEWPQLPKDLPDNSIAKNMKEAFLHVSIHDSISFQKMKRCLSLKSDESSKGLKIRQITEERYAELCSLAEEPLPILQSIVYTSAKQDMQGWKRQYWEFIDEANGNTVGEFISLKKYGLVYRINHGPIVKSGYEKKAMLLIKNKFSAGGKILFIAPNMERNGKNLMFLVGAGYKYRKAFFSTGFIDLRLDENSLRKNLDSRWRRCLKNAEKQNLLLEYIVERKDFEMLLDIHSKDKAERNFIDSGDKLTRYLFLHNAMLCMTAKNEQREIISFIMVALHEKTATYYIGWNSAEGYKLNVSRLLLWVVMGKLKEIGMEWFDLGGIDFISTKGIAEFKVGTGCKPHEYVGEFVIW